MCCCCAILCMYRNWMWWCWWYYVIVIHLSVWSVSHFLNKSEWCCCHEEVIFNILMNILSRAMFYKILLRFLYLLDKKFILNFSTSTLIIDSHFIWRLIVRENLICCKTTSSLLRAHDISITSMYLNIFYQRKLIFALKSVSWKWST